MKSKKAFSLSVNFLVTLIIMVVLFGFGIYLFVTLISESEQIYDDVTRAEKDNLDKIIESGKIVAVSSPQKTYGEELLRFPIAISNENTANSTDKFKFNITSCKFANNTPPASSIITCDDILKYDDNSFNINNNQRIHKLLLVNPRPQDSNGFYTITFYVQRKEAGWQNYDSKQMIWVIMP